MRLRPAQLSIGVKLPLVFCGLILAVIVALSVTKSLP